MICVKIIGGVVVGFGDKKYSEIYESRLGNQWQCPWDWTSFEQVEEIAKKLSDFVGLEYLAVDNGEWAYPRFDVVEAFKVGDKVSKAFNGDYYPAGVIVSVSKSHEVVTTSSGLKFYRRKLSSQWIADGTWGLFLWRKIREESWALINQRRSIEYES